MNFPSFKAPVEPGQMGDHSFAASIADVPRRSARKYAAKRWCMVAAGVLLMSGWAAQAQLAAGAPPMAANTLPSAARPAAGAPSMLTCPEDSPRICTPHGCFCT